MGGDSSPRVEIEGAALALQQLGDALDLTIVGQHTAQDYLRTHRISERVRFVLAPDVVTMHHEPAAVLKQMPESSLVRGLQQMHQGDADAFVSAGNTGAVMATATMLCGRIKGVSRPTIGSFIPTQQGTPTLLLDVGANVDSKPRYYLDYAIMGEIYYRLMMNVQEPTVGILNVGEEDSKGTETVKEARVLCTKAPFNFVGNVEGRDILKGTAHVVVCDGFEGNIVLKFAESVLGFLRWKLRNYAKRGIFPMLAMAAFKPILKKALADMDYQNYGGVPLLGINGIVIIGHGSSSAKAIANMIVRATEVHTNNVNGAIADAMQRQREQQEG
jgi:phosphate acyltransferase